ncbi:MAG: phage minor head protein [Methanobrevibacter sp.]|uniref:phage minor head protein n=1 Tax=Methanobrevibacter sp. TaxID=66852 RepID=UPI0026DEE764|nr:phage minor head protein [Methanobrevibacter sp.]MDO5849301.1 phage minor head protein [Methanobrevibacter sp.]
MIVDIERRKTNWLLMEILDFDNKINKSLSSDDLEYSRHLMRMIDSTLSKYSQWINSNEAKEYFYNNIKLTEEVFEAIDDELDEIVYDTSLSADEIIERMYRAGESRGYRDIRQARVFNDSSMYALEFLQDYNFDLIKRLSDDLRGSVRHHIFRGVAEGQSVYEVAKAIEESGLKPLEGMTLSATQRAKMIARTEVGRAMLTGTLQAYENYGVEQVEVLTAEDTNVCTICQQAEKNNPYSIEDTDNLPLYHPNCRCTITAIVDEYEELEIKENPKFMDFTSDNKKYSYDEHDIDWSEESIKNSLKDVVDDDDINCVTYNLIHFINKIKKKEIEYLTTTDAEFKIISDATTDFKKDKIGLPKSDRDEVKNSYFGLTIHNHPSGIPLPHEIDLCTGIIDNKVKYNIIYSSNGFMVIRNKFYRDEGDIDKSRYKDFHKDYKRAYRKRNTFLNEKSTKEKQKYKESIDIYSISGFKLMQNLENISKSVEISTFKAQTKIFNDYLKKYGIKMTFIKPK